MTNTDLIKIAYQSILSMSTDDGINASGKEEIYGCIFGRDSFITILKLLKVITNRDSENYFEIGTLKNLCYKTLNTLIALQGKETNLESGEEPGKFIHEYRKDKYERLVNKPVHPWYLYPDKIMRNYDSLDSTPLGLIAIYKYWKHTQDNIFLLKALPSVEAGLNWIITYGDRDKDTLLEYELPQNRTHGGLCVQSWTDSKESLLQHDGSFPIYPIAPVEVQGYSWLALKLWADYYRDTKNNFIKSRLFAHKLKKHADQLRDRFNRSFIFESEGLQFPSQALDGRKNKIKTVTGNPLLLLWATYFKDGKPQAVLDNKHIPDLVSRIFMNDMFDMHAGIRTMSSKSLTYIPGQNSYHNGSFWPKLNGMAHEGLINWGYEAEAEMLRSASLKPYAFFGTPIELYIKNNESLEYMLYRNDCGQESCQVQAWSASSFLDLLTL